MGAGEAMAFTLKNFVFTKLIKKPERTVFLEKRHLHLVFLNLWLNYSKHLLWDLHLENLRKHQCSTSSLEFLLPTVLNFAVRHSTKNAIDRLPFDQLAFTALGLVNDLSN